VFVSGAQGAGENQLGLLTLALRSNSKGMRNILQAFDTFPSSGNPNSNHEPLASKACGLVIAGVKSLF
jgi:hypothetical protein